MIASHAPAVVIGRVPVPTPIPILVATKRQLARKAAPRHNVQMKEEKSDVTTVGWQTGWPKLPTETKLYPGAQPPPPPTPPAPCAFVQGSSSQSQPKTVVTSSCSRRRTSNSPRPHQTRGFIEPLAALRRPLLSLSPTPRHPTRLTPPPPPPPPPPPLVVVWPRPRPRLRLRLRLSRLRRLARVVRMLVSGALLERRLLNDPTPRDDLAGLRTDPGGRAPVGRRRGEYRRDLLPPPPSSSSSSLESPAAAAWTHESAQRHGVSLYLLVSAGPSLARAGTRAHGWQRAPPGRPRTGARTDCCSSRAIARHS